MVSWLICPLVKEITKSHIPLIAKVTSQELSFKDNTQINQSIYDLN